MRNILAILIFLFASRSVADLVPYPAGEEQGRITYDIGVSTGSTGGSNYTEANIGLNWWFHESFAWRNSIFGRWQQDVENIYGLDTSIRGSHTFQGEASSLNVFAGPGWRFVNKGSSAPIAEGGAIFKVGGLSLGGGAKVVFHEAVNKDVENDVQYFIIIGGGGTL